MMPKIAFDRPGDIWFFAYGSLMWDPGFDFVETRSALLRGYHRKFCVDSTVYRGTPERPGLVLGLDRGGAVDHRARDSSPRLVALLRPRRDHQLGPLDGGGRR